MDPIRPIGQDDTLRAIERAELHRVRHETDEEAAERRRQQAEERERERQRHLQEEARANGQPLPAVPGKPAYTPAEAADDGHPHCDFRV